jgi:hypothetical protein
MLYPANLANVIGDKVMAFFSGEDFNPRSPPSPAEIGSAIGEGIKKYLEDNMTFVLQITSPPIMTNPSGTPSAVPDPLLSPLTMIPIPVTGALKLGGTFSCESLLPADIAEGICKMLEGAYLTVNLDDILSLPAMPAIPEIPPPEIPIPFIKPPEVRLTLPQPRLKCSLPLFSFPAVGINPKITAAFEKTPNAELDANINVTRLSPSLSVSLPPPSLKLETGTITVNPPVIGVHFTPPAISPASVELSIEGMNITLTIPDVMVDPASFSITEDSPMAVTLAEYAITAEDAAVSSLDLNGKYSVELELKITDKHSNTINPYEYQLPKLAISIELPVLGDIAVELGNIGSADFDLGEFGMQLKQGLLSIPFLRPLVIPPDSFAIYKKLRSIHLADETALGLVRIPAFFSGAKVNITASLPKINLKKHGVDLNQKGAWVIKETVKIDLQDVPAVNLGQFLGHRSYILNFPD